MNIVAYSYKGGSGRTTAAANVAAALFKCGKKVACVDLDFGAPGLHELVKFDLSMWHGLDSVRRGIVLTLGGERTEVERFGVEGVQHYLNNPTEYGSSYEFVVNHGCDYKHSTLDRYTSGDEAKLDSIGMTRETYDSGELLFLPASPFEKSVTALGRGSGEYSADKFREYIEELQEGVSAYFTSKRGTGETNNEGIYFIFDSASGITYNSLPVLKMGNMILMFFRWSNQHMLGSSQNVEALCRWLSNRLDSLRTRIYLIGSCAFHEEEMEAQERLNKDMQAQQKLELDAVSKMMRTRRDQLEARMKSDRRISYISPPIPEYITLKYFESIVAFKDQLPDYDKIRRAFENVAAVVIEDEPKVRVSKRRSGDENLHSQPL